MQWQKTLLVACVAIGMTGAVMAADGHHKVPKKPVSQWTCEEFLEIREDFKPQVISWTEALNKNGKPEEAIIDVSGIEKITPMVIAHCKANPKSKFWTGVTISWQKVDKTM